MPSSRKSESARANGAKSHGPKTEAGKQRSSQNAIKHGLTSQTLVLPSEDPADFQRLLDSYLQQFRPAGPVELDLVHEIVAAKWRLNRIALIETQLLAAQIEDIERDNQDDFDEGDTEELLSPVQSLAKAFDRLSGRSLPFLYRLESRLERTYSRALRTLFQLQELRRPCNPPGPGTRNEICTIEPTSPVPPNACFDLPPAQNPARVPTDCQPIDDATPPNSCRGVPLALGTQRRSGPDSPKEPPGSPTRRCILGLDPDLPTEVQENKELGVTPAAAGSPIHNWQKRV